MSEDGEKPAAPVATQPELFVDPKEKTLWAKCCGRLYNRPPKARAYWLTCLSCKKPLSYGREIPQ